MTFPRHEPVLIKENARYIPFILILSLYTVNHESRKGTGYPLQKNERCSKFTPNNKSTTSKNKFSLLTTPLYEKLFLVTQICRSRQKDKQIFDIL